MSKKHRWRVPFKKQHGKRAQTRFKSERRHLGHSYWSLRRELSFKKSLLVIWKILRLFINTFTPGDSYFLLNRGNLRQPIQMQLSRKQKVFSNFFFKFWDLHWIVNIFNKKITLIATFFWKLQTPKNEVRYVSKKRRLTVPFNKQHGKRAETLFKSKWRHLYHIYW